MFMKKNIKLFLGFIFLLVGTVANSASIFDTNAVSAKFMRPADYSVEPGAKIAVLAFADDFNDASKSGAVANWMVDNFVSLIQGDISNLVGGERSDIAKRLTKDVSEEIKNDSRFIFIESSQASANADYYVTGGITNFITEVNKEYESNEGKKTTRYRKRVCAGITYQLIDAKTNLILYTKSMEINRENVSERNAPHAIGMVSGDIKSRAVEIVDTIRIHKVNMVEYLAVPKKKSSDFKKALKLANNDNYSQAQKSFADIYSSEKTYEAGYNSAVLLYITGNFDKALEEMNAIADKFNKAEANKMISKINQEIEYKKLLEKF